MILQALNGYYERVATADQSIPQFGYGIAPVSFALVLNPSGDVVDVADVRRVVRNKSRPTDFLVPKDFDDRTAGDAAPRAFWDKPEYVLGVSEKPERASRRFNNFKFRHIAMFAGYSDPGLDAIRAFLTIWTADKFSTIRYADQITSETNIAFRLDGVLGFIHDTHAARAAWQKSISRIDGTDAQCLVSGADVSPARIHPLIKNISAPGKPTPKFISFDKDSDAYASYGKVEGANAPVSEATAFAYSTALNELLSRTSGRDHKDRPIYRNRVQIGDATTVFWGEAADAELAESSEDLMAALFNPPDEAADDDASATAKLRDVVKQMADGRPIEQAAPNLAADTRFYVLGLSPNAARISVRFWHQTTLGELGAAFVQHWQDLRIDPPPWRTAPSIWRLLIETAPQRKSDNVQSNLAGEVMRAILDRTRYPATLLTSVVMRMRADGGRVERGSEQSSIGHRAALIKACLIRQKETVPVSLDRSNNNAGYQLGRLFAALETTQRAALPGLNATIRDRYFGAASAAPASVFPVLIRNSNHHLSNLRKGDKGGLAVWLEREIGEIIDGMTAQFPASLRMQEQGQFAIGYYHQRFAKRADKPAEIAEDATISCDTTE